MANRDAIARGGGRTVQASGTTEPATERSSGWQARHPAAARQPSPPRWSSCSSGTRVERLKREKSPLGMLDELPALIAAGYADVAEEDIVRLKWWGLYHDKPKIGTFMLRIKLAAGRLTAAQLRRRSAQLSLEHGKGEAELTTRQNVQLHYLDLAALPDVFETLRRRRADHLGGCGDAVRNITGCPVAGIAHDELFDVEPRRRGERTRSSTATPTTPTCRASTRSRSAPARTAATRRRSTASRSSASCATASPGSRVLVGGGLSSVPRIARDLGVFVRRDEAMPVLRALLDAWREDLRYRVSRVKARMKFMVDDIGPEGMREEVEQRLGYALPDFPLPPLEGQFADHIGVERAEAGRADGDRRPRPPRAHLRRPDARRSPSLADEHGGDGARHAPAEPRARPACPTPTSSARSRGSSSSASRSTRTRSALGSIGCTGEPHCNFAVTETKTRLGALVDTLEGRFGDDVAPLRLHLDGCPHACGQHWVGDLGFQGTTARDEEGSGSRHTTSTCAARSARGRRSAGRSSAACRRRSSTRSSPARDRLARSSARRARASGRSATAPTTRRSASSRAVSRRRAAEAREEAAA